MTIPGVKPCARKFASFFISCGILALSPILIFTALALLSLRFFLSLLKSLWNPSFGPLLSGMSNAFSTDWPYSGEPSLTVGGYIIFDARMSLPEFKSTVHSRLSSNPLYPHLQYFLTTWFGFSVWCKDPQFSIDNQVRDIPGDLYLQIKGDSDPLSEDNVNDFLHKYSKIPFTSGRPPWDLTLCHNAVLKGRSESTTIFFIRIHHSMADATVIMRIFAAIFDEDQDVLGNIMEKLKKGLPRTKRSTFGKAWFYLSYPVLSVYEAVDHLLASWDLNEWNNWSSPVRKDFHYVRAHVTKADVNVVREANRVSFFSVVLAAQTAALRRYMVKHGVEVPEALHACVTIPIPSKGVNIGNNLTFVCINLPVGLNNRHQVLRKIHQDQLKLKTTRVPLFIYALQLFNGLLPKRLVYTTWRLTTCASSNFPGYEEQPKFNGTKVLDMGATAATPSTIGIYLWSFGFTDKISLSFGVSKDIMPDRSHVEECAKYALEELQALKDGKEPCIIPPKPGTSKSIRL